MLHRADGEQHRDGGTVGREPAIGENDNLGAARFHGFLSALAEIAHRRAERVGAGREIEQDRQTNDCVAENRHGGQGLHFVIEEDGRVQGQDAGRGKSGFEETHPWPERRAERHDELFADGVDRRVRDLGEELLEIGVEQARPAREHRERRIVAHRSGGLETFGQWGENEFLLLGVVSVRELLLKQRCLVGRGRLDDLGCRACGGEFLPIDQVARTPLTRDG